MYSLPDCTPHIYYIVSCVQLVLYYSGHGVVDKEGNYCAVPIDFVYQTQGSTRAEDDVAASSPNRSHLINLRTRFVRKLIAQEGSQKDLPGKPAKGCAIIVLLDMCRSPFLEAMHRDPVKDLVSPSCIHMSNIVFTCLACVHTAFVLSFLLVVHNPGSA